MENKLSQLIYLSEPAFMLPFIITEWLQKEIIPVSFYAARNFPLILYARSKIERLYFSSA